MTTNGSIKQLLAQLAERTERAAMQAASAERRAGLAEERTARLETVLSADRSPGDRRIRRRLPREPKRDRGQGNKSRLSRAAFLGKAGALVAGAAGAALLEAHGTKDAYATTDTNFVVAGFAAGGGTGFQTTATSSFAYGYIGGGSVFGAYISGSDASATGDGGIGVLGTGGQTSGAGSAGAGVLARGGGSGGTGAAGPGVLAVGGGATSVPGAAGV
jgi:hypothetical protein